MMEWLDVQRYEREVAEKSDECLERILSGSSSFKTSRLVFKASRKPVRWFDDVLCAMEHSGRVVQTNENGQDVWVPALLPPDEGDEVNRSRVVPLEGALLQFLVVVCEGDRTRVESEVALRARLDAFASRNLEFDFWWVCVGTCSDMGRLTRWRDHGSDDNDDRLPLVLDLLQRLGVAVTPQHSPGSGGRELLWTLPPIAPRTTAWQLPQETHFLQFLATTPSVLGATIRTAWDLMGLLQRFRGMLASDAPFGRWWITSRRSPDTLVRDRLMALGIVSGRGTRFSPFQWHVVALLERVPPMDSAVVLNEDLRGAIEAGVERFWPSEKDVLDYETNVLEMAKTVVARIRKQPTNQVKLATLVYKATTKPAAWYSDVLSMVYQEDDIERVNVSDESDFWRVVRRAAVLGFRLPSSAAALEIIPDQGALLVYLWRARVAIRGMEDLMAQLVLFGSADDGPRRSRFRAWYVNFMSDAACCFVMVLLAGRASTRSDEATSEAVATFLQDATFLQRNGNLFEWAEPPSIQPHQVDDEFESVVALPCEQLWLGLLANHAQRLKAGVVPSPMDLLVLMAPFRAQLPTSSPFRLWWVTTTAPPSKCMQKRMSALGILPPWRHGTKKSYREAFEWNLVALIDHLSHCTEDSIAIAGPTAQSQETSGPDETLTHMNPSPDATPRGSDTVMPPPIVGTEDIVVSLGLSSKDDLVGIVSDSKRQPAKAQVLDEGLVKASVMDPWNCIEAVPSAYAQNFGGASHVPQSQRAMESPRTPSRLEILGRQKINSQGPIEISDQLHREGDILQSLYALKATIRLESDLTIHVGNGQAKLVLAILKQLDMVRGAGTSSDPFEWTPASVLNEPENEDDVDHALPDEDQLLQFLAMAPRQRCAQTTEAGLAGVIKLFHATLPPTSGFGLWWTSLASQPIRMERIQSRLHTLGILYRRVEGGKTGQNRTLFQWNVVALMEKLQEKKTVCSQNSPLAPPTLLLDQAPVDTTNEGVVLAAVTKFTRIALEYLAKNPVYHVAEIAGHTKSIKLSNMSHVVFVDQVVASMNMNTRLCLDVDTKGRSVFKLAGTQANSSAITVPAVLQPTVESMVETPNPSVVVQPAPHEANSHGSCRRRIEDLTGKCKAIALAYLKKNPSYHVADIRGTVSQLKPVERDNQSVDHFVDQIVTRLVQDARLERQVNAKGQALLVLQKEAIEVEPKSNGQMTRLSQETCANDLGWANFNISTLTQDKPNNSKATPSPNTDTVVVEELTPSNPMSLLPTVSGVDPSGLSCKVETMTTEDASWRRLDVIAAKYKAVALAYLQKNSFYHVADIRGSVSQLQPVERSGQSVDHVVNQIVALLLQDPRLEGKTDAKGRPILVLSASKPASAAPTAMTTSSKPASIASAVKTVAAEQAAIAITYLKTHRNYPNAYYPVSHMVTNIRDSKPGERGGLSLYAFVEKVEKAMGKHEQLEATTTTDGKSIFKLNMAGGSGIRMTQPKQAPLPSLECLASLPTSSLTNTAIENARTPQPGNNEMEAPA
ncbi:hypothetical protein As57867_015893, partial [Aphanomyces stellatus]